MRYRSKPKSEESRARARDLRKNMSISEEVFWAYLRGDKTGFRFRRQVPVLDYFLDFYCGEAALCVEVDGEQHQLRIERDNLRDARLLEIGIKTIRIPSLDLFDNRKELVEQWILRIKAECWERVSRTSTPQPPPPAGAGGGGVPEPPSPTPVGEGGRGERE